MQWNENAVNRLSQEFLYFLESKFNHEIYRFYYQEVIIGGVMYDGPKYNNKYCHDFVVTGVGMWTAKIT
jgi:hypothetical protein